MSYKAKDLTIISPITLGQVIPEDVGIPQIDTSVQSLLSTNLYQGQSRQYSGDITDLSYASKQTQKQMLEQTYLQVEELTAQLPRDENRDQTFP